MQERIATSSMMEPFDPTRTKWDNWLERFEENWITKSTERELSTRVELAYLKVEDGTQVTEMLKVLPRRTVSV